MDPRRCALSLLVVLVSGSAHAESECEVGLTTPVRSDAPTPIDPDRRAPEIFGQMIEVIRREPNVAGTNNAMIVLNGEIRPVLDAVANYLSSRENYPGGFSGNQATDLASSLFSELSRRLDVLKESRAEAVAPVRTRINWWRLQREPVPRAEQGDLKVRYLHFALNYAAEKLAADVKKWPQALGQTNVLRERMRQVGDLLVQIQGRLDVETDDWTFKLRLKNLIDDVRNQDALLERVHMSIEQRIQYANAVLDDIRTLLVVRLPLEAVMGDQPLDLSPLEPPDFSAAPGLADDVSPSAPQLKEDIDSIIKAAQNMSDFAPAREILLRFVETNARHLNVAQAIKVATCVWTSDYTVNLVLARFVELRKHDLSQNEILQIANACRSDTAKQNIIKHISISGVAKLGARFAPPMPPDPRGVL